MMLRHLDIKEILSARPLDLEAMALQEPKPTLLTAEYPRPGRRQERFFPLSDNEMRITGLCDRLFEEMEEHTTHYGTIIEEGDLEDPIVQTYTSAAVKLYLLWEHFSLKLHDELEFRSRKFFKEGIHVHIYMASDMRVYACLGDCEECTKERLSKLH